MTATTVAQPRLPPWWLVLLEGIALFIVGLFLLTDPGTTAIILVQVLAIFWLVRGIFDIVSIFIHHKGWVWRLISGVLGIIAGIVILNHPIWSPLIVGAVLVLMVGIFGIFIGIMGLIAAFQGEGWGRGILSAVSLFFGIYLTFNAGATALVLPWALGILGLIGGIAAIILSFKVRQVAKA